MHLKIRTTTFNVITKLFIVQASVRRS